MFDFLRGFFVVFFGGDVGGIFSAVFFHQHF